VLDRRTGIPITLSVVYMEVARRAGLQVDGINFPGHFLVRCPDACCRKSWPARGASCR
jgi:regulator of sirC expression with transglutaminase-like and TPR domain